MTKELTAVTIEKIKPGDKRREIPDGRIPGLYLVVQPNGKRSWAFRYRLDGKSRKFTVGQFPAISLKSAREKAGAAKDKVADGKDPCAEKKSSKAAATIPAIDLVEVVTAQFISHYARRQLKAGTAKEVERLLEKEIVRPWRGRRLSEIGRADIHELLDNIVERGSPITANRTLAWLRRMCSWAVERGLMGANPCTGIKAPAAETARDRVLSDEELKAVWLAAGALEWPYATFVKMLIVTGARRSEVAGMCWQEIDFASKTWVIPKERSKNGIEHTVPLPNLAIDILSGCPRIGDNVLTFSGRAQITGFAIMKARLDGLLPPGMSAWTFHDVRRTFASGCARLGVQLPVVEKLLNHTGNSFKGVAGVYQRHDFANEKRVAVQTWAWHVEALVTGTPAANIVPIRK